MRGFSSGARGGSRFARAHLVFGLLRHALHDRVHRVTLDVILLLLRLRADVRDDLFEKRRGGTVSLFDRGRKNFEGGRAARARGRAPRTARRRIALDARTPSPSWCTCSRSPWWPISALRLRTRAYPSAAPGDSHLVLGAGAVGQRPTDQPPEVLADVSLCRGSRRRPSDRHALESLHGGVRGGRGRAPSVSSERPLRHARGRRPRRRVRRSSRQAFLR